jgi:hypothetical protein
MTEQQRKDICVEVVKKLGRFEWFRDVVVWENHPIALTKVLELKVNYVPRLAEKEVKTFALSLGFSDVRWQEVDANGNAV